MSTHLTRPRAVLAVGLIAAVAAVGSYAFTASNSVPDSNAGYATSTVSGYDVTAISYHLFASDPTKSDYATFDVAAQNGGVAPTSVSAKPGAAASRYDACVFQSGTAWKCTWTSDGSTGAPVNVEDIDTLDVVAVQ